MQMPNYPYLGKKRLRDYLKKMYLKLLFIIKLLLLTKLLYLKKS